MYLRWVQQHGRELEKRCSRHLKPTNKSYRVDETYIKVKGKDQYLYRTVDSNGQTIDFLLTANRDATAAKCCFRTVLARLSNPQPRVINVDRTRPTFLPSPVEVRESSPSALSFTPMQVLK